MVETERGREKEGEGKETRRKEAEDGGGKEKLKKKVKKVAEECEICNKKKEAAKSEKKAKKLIPQKFHKWTHIFKKKASKRTPMKKLWDYVIEVKEGFVPRKKKMYLLSRKERKEVYEFIEEKLKKKYIRPLKLFQIVSVFFVDKIYRKQIV